MRGGLHVSHLILTRMLGGLYFCFRDEETDEGPRSQIGRSGPKTSVSMIPDSIQARSL